MRNDCVSRLGADKTLAMPIHATYDYRLVALSVIIAIFASYAALELAGRVTAARNSARVAWLLGGASAMGTGHKLRRLIRSWKKSGQCGLTRGRP